jgi:hypothetical protein
MKNKKKITVWIIVILLTISIAGCGVDKPELATPSATLTTAEATLILTPTMSPTATATEIVLLNVDVTQPPDKWDLSAVPAAQRALIEQAISKAGKEAQNAFDTLLISSWRSVLEKAGVPNAKSLADYKLLDTIVDYAEANDIYEVTLPFSTHRLILTDPENLVPTSRRPDVPESTDAWYGLEQNTTTMSSTDLREYSAFNFKTVNFYGEDIKHTESDPPFTMTRFGSGARGDLVMLVNLPGIDPTKEQGALLVLYDASGNRHYFETNMVYDAELKTGIRDLCLVTRGNLNTVEQCQADIKLGQTLKLVDQNHFTGNHPLTQQELLDFLSQDGSHHVEIRSGNLDGGGLTHPGNIWQNGVGVATSIAFIPTVFP